MMTNNYFDYYNRFWQAGEIMPFTSSATALYFYLLYEANRRFWQMPILCSTSYLTFRLNLSKQGVYDARKLLSERGFLKYINGDKSGAVAQYTIILPSTCNVSSEVPSEVPSEVSSDVSSIMATNVSSNVPSNLSSEVASLHLTNSINSENNKLKQNTSTIDICEEITLEILKQKFSNDTVWLRHIADTLSGTKIRSPDDVLTYLNRFFDEQIAQGIKAREESDCRKHFFYWLKKIIQNNKTNVFKNKLSQQRRGTGVSTGTAADFEQPFNAADH